MSPHVVETDLSSAADAKPVFVYNNKVEKTGKRRKDEARQKKEKYGQTKDTEKNKVTNNTAFIQQNY
tara:strand:+ start:37 stop:237 length:201 start_codon:yes stop_codon:yes gene_type:complete